jgi:hypothetical protein
MAIDIGIDDGGSGDRLLMGLQFGEVSKARKLARDWKRELRRREIPFFHSKDFHNYSGGVFDGLSRRDRHELLTYLSSLIHKRFRFGFTVETSVSRYNALLTNDERSVHGTAYSYAIWVLLMLAQSCMEYLHMGLDANILVEDGHRNSQQIYQQLLAFKLRRAEALEKGGLTLNLLTVGLGSKADNPILQAADMLSYSEWQKIIGGNLDIYNALHIRKSKYDTRLIDLSQEFVPIGVKHVKAHEAKRKQHGQRRPIQSVQSNDEQSAVGATQQDQGKTGRGEEGEKAEES